MENLTVESAFLTTSLGISTDKEDEYTKAYAPITLLKASPSPSLST